MSEKGRFAEPLEQRDSDASATSSEDFDDFDEGPHFLVYTHCDTTAGEIVGRYLAAVRRLGKQIDRFTAGGAHIVGEMYNFEPCLVAQNVKADVLEELPTLVGDKYVKSIVQNGDLLIINIGTGSPHGAGVLEICRQAGNWSDLEFIAETDAVIKTGDGRKGFAPDLVIKVSAEHLPPGVPHAHLIIIELEVSNRSIWQMRRDYLKYFQFDPCVYSVVGIKMLPGNNHTPCQRALAVQWTRHPEGGVIETEGQWDFGLLSISHSAGTLFSDPLVDALPPVPRDSWAQHRYVPVPMDTLTEPPYSLPHNAPNPDVAAASARFLATGPRANAALYGGAAPRVRFDRNALNMYRHNLPPDAPAIQDFVLDLGRVLFVTQRSAPRL